MFEINITVSCPDLVQAATIFATAMGSIKISEPTVTIPAAAPAVTSTSDTARPAQYGSATPAVAAALTPPVGQTTPATANPTNGQSSMMASMMSSCPSNAAPAGGVPLAQAPTFTLEQVSKAGADLVTVQPAKMQELMNLLAQFGVQTVNALKPEQLGAFATALRGMGAQI